MAYDNTNTGALFKNDTKQEEGHSDYQGSINVGGVEYWLSAWIREGKAGGKMEGRKFMSLKVKPKEAPKPKPKHATDFPELDDDHSEIPF